MTVGDLKDTLEDIPDDRPVTFKIIEEGWFSRRRKFAGIQHAYGTFLKKGEHCDAFPAVVLTGSRSE